MVPAPTKVVDEGVQADRWGVGATGLDDHVATRLDGEVAMRPVVDLVGLGAVFYGPGAEVVGLLIGQ